MTRKFQRQFVLWTTVAVCALGTSLLTAHAQTPQAQPATDITGKWHFVFQTDGGPREFDATFQQDGDKITGKWDDKDDLKGTFSGGKLSLEFTANSEEVGPGTLKINGDFANDALTGTWSFQDYDGTFKATRSKPATT
jgi:hypothetical protein